MQLTLLLIYNIHCVGEFKLFDPLFVSCLLLFSFFPGSIVRNLKLLPPRRNTKKVDHFSEDFSSRISGASYNRGIKLVHC